jgi:hypothetical protein
MAIDKLFPRYLNKDDDDRILKSIELSDALNIRVSNDEDGNSGVIKNVKGNTLVAYASSSDTLPSGTNRTIGNVTNMQKDEVYYFVYNSNEDHTIYKYSVKLNRATKIYQDSVLGFSEKSFVKADVIVNQRDETLLYFTDGKTAPKKINATKAERGGYPTDYSKGTNPSTTLTDAERLLFITTAKQPPLDAPQWEFFTDSDISFNNLYEQMFQFAYQYVYADGEVSAISPYSSVTYSSNQLIDGITSEENKKKNNALRVTVKTNVGDVSKIRVLARSGKEGAFFIVDEIANDRSAVVNKTVEFTNDASYSVVSNDERNKLFDNVPLTAETQAISGNRLMFGNYVEGYDNVNIDAEVLPNYVKRGTTSDAVLTSNLDKQVELDLSTLPGSLEEGSVFTVDFSLDVDYVKLRVRSHPVAWSEFNNNKNLYGRMEDYINVDMTPVKVNESVVVSSSFDKEQLANAIIAAISKQYSVSFDSVDQFSDHASKIKDVEPVALLGDNERWGFWTGTGFVGVSASYDLTTEIITINFSVASAQLRISTLYGSTTDIGGDAPDYTDPRSINKTSQTTPLGDFSININYTGDLSTFTSYNGTAAAYPHFTFPSTYGFNSEFEGQTQQNNSRYIKGTQGSPSFKAGATHSFGVVYYDDRNRSGSVNKVGKSYVKWFSERGNKGETSMVMRIKNSAPSWAKRWAPVYAGNTSIVSFLQYSAIEAFAATNPTVKNINSTYNDKIFVSLRSLSGKEDSYREAKGALIDYAYNEGDKLRIYKFGGTYYPDGVDFNVVGYEYFDDSATTNPILDDTNDNTTYRTTGFFLILEDNGSSKFGKAAVVGGNDDWDNKCIVEIYSKKKTTEGLPYYEIGHSYPVVNGVHEGDRTAATATFDVIDNGGWGAFYSTEKVFKGDIFQSAGGVKIKVNNVYLSDVSPFTYQGDCTILSGTSATGVSMTIQNNDPVVEVVEGDVWFRLRQLRHGVDVDEYNYLTDYIEDFSLSDFFSSNENSQGRANLYSPTAMQIKRLASVTYSEPFVFDSSQLQLSSFNLSLANFKDFDTTYGGIKYTYSVGDGVVMLQDSKLSVVPVSRNLIEYASDNANLVASNDILGTPVYRSGDFGCDDNPESVVVRFGRVFYTDAQSGKVMAFGASGVEPISEQKMDSFFTKSFSNAKKFANSLQINGGFDPDNNEYIVSIPSIYSSSVSVDIDGGGSFDSDLQTESDGTVDTNVSFGSDFLQWETTDINWESMFMNHEDAGNGVVYFEDGSSQLSNDLETSTDVVNVVVTNANNDFYGEAQVDLAASTVAFADTEGLTFTSAGANEVFTGYTVGYDAKGGFWTSFYSYIPERMGYIKNSFFTFSGGRMYTHDTNNTRNNFYGTQYNSKLVAASTINPSLVKSYESISLEGSAPWSGTFTNTDQSSTVPVGAFDKRERNYYAHINRDTANSTSNMLSIGKAYSVAGDKINVGSRISDMPIAIGADIYKVDGSSITDTGLDVVSVSGRRQITASATVSNVNTGDDLLIVSSDSIDGDPMRDSFLKIELENTSTDHVELYAINTVFSKSNLHNQQGA